MTQPILIKNVGFTRGLESAFGTHTVHPNLQGTTVEVMLIGEGGSGGAGVPGTNAGGGGGGAGGVVKGTMAAQPGDQFIVAHTPNNDRTTSGDGADGGSITIHNTRTQVTWIANGGSGGIHGDGGAGGAGGSGTAGQGATITTGGSGGRAGKTDGSGRLEPLSGATIGATLGGAAGANGTVTFGGGGGGAIGDPSQAFLDVWDGGFGVSEFESLNGGSGASSSADVVSTRTASSTVYVAMDGEDGKNGPSEWASEYIGMGGGGAGAPHSSSTGSAFGGAGGDAAALIRYSYEAVPPTIDIYAGNKTVAVPYLVEIGSTFVEPGVSGADIQGVELAVTTTLPTELQGSISGTVGSQYEITYTVTDDVDAVAEATRVVEVQDTTKPVIILNGSTIQYVIADEQLSYTDPGAIGYDNSGGGSGASGEYTMNDLTVTGNVNRAVAGTYTITYDLTVGGLTADTMTRTVIVQTFIPQDANTGNPHSTPGSGQIKFSEIISASQLFRRVDPGATQRSTLSHVDAQPRLLHNVSINDLRLWFTKYGCPSDANRTLSTSNPGADGNLKNHTTDQSEINASNFYDYSGHTVAYRVKAETYDVYYSSNNAEIQVAAWGPTNTTTAPGRYTVTISTDYTGDLTSSNLQQGTGYQLSSINRDSGAGPGTKNTTYNNKDVVSHTYGISIAFTNTSGHTTTWNKSSITIGRTGTSSTSLNVAGSKVMKFQWGGNSTAKNTLSDVLLEHLGGTTLIERRV